MQTFLSFPNYIKIAKQLDWRRLGKQRVEAFQILNILLGVTPNSRWKHHPAVLMWKGYEESLKLYFNVMSSEWIRRGYVHNMGFYVIDYDKLINPPWIGDPRLHWSHQSNLLRKDYEWYSQFFIGPNDWLYFWPVTKNMNVNYENIR